MEKVFSLEVDLVKEFINQYTLLYDEIIVCEHSIRMGNIDVVTIKNSNMNLSMKQINTLAKPSNALVFSRIKNKRGISKEKLDKVLWLSKSTLESCLYELINTGLICRDETGLYTKTVQFAISKSIITGYEAKLTNFDKAFYQAHLNQNYVDYSYILFPMNRAIKINENKIELLQKNGVGLIGVDYHSTKVFVKAKKTNNVKPYLRLLNVMKASSLKCENDYIKSNEQTRR